MKNTSQRPLLLVVLLALVLGLLRLNAVPFNYENGQTDNFWPIAINLLDGKGYTLCYPLYFPFCENADQHTAIREPLPVLLYAAAAVVTGRSLPAVMHVQILFFLGVLLLLHRLVRRWSDERTALLAALFWAVYLPAFPVMAQLSGDLPGAFFFMLALNALDEARRSGKLKWWILTGVALGLTGLCRSVLLAVALPWAVVAWYQGRERGVAIASALKPVLALFLMTGLVMSPWVIRNQLVLGKAYVGTSMNGYNIFRESSIVSSPDYFRYVASPEAQRMMDELVARRTDLKGTEGEVEMDRVYMEEGMRALKVHPGRYVALSLYRFVPLWFNWGVKDGYGRAFTLFDWAIVVQQALLLLLALVGLQRTGRTSWPWAATMAIVVLAYMAVVAQVRYVLPIMPLVMGFAAIGLMALWRRRRAGA